MSAITKGDVLRWAKWKGVEIEDDGKVGRDREGNVLDRHIHAYAPRGYRFANTDTHNQGLGNFGKGERPDWLRIQRDLNLEPCTDPDCDYCHPAEE